MQPTSKPELPAQELLLAQDIYKEALLIDEIETASVMFTSQEADILELPKADPIIERQLVPGVIELPMDAVFAVGIELHDQMSQSVSDTPPILLEVQEAMPVLSGEINLINEAVIEEPEPQELTGLALDSLVEEPEDPTLEISTLEEPVHKTSEPLFAVEDIAPEMLASPEIIEALVPLPAETVDHERLTLTAKKVETMSELQVAEVNSVMTKVIECYEQLAEKIIADGDVTDEIREQFEEFCIELAVLLEIEPESPEFTIILRSILRAEPIEKTDQIIADETLWDRGTHEIITNVAMLLKNIKQIVTLNVQGWLGRSAFTLVAARDAG